MVGKKEIHDGTFLKIWWDDSNRIIGIDWKDSTGNMSEDDFRSDLSTFAGYVEQRQARGILVDVARFRHRPGPDMQEWRVKNISPRYYGAGVRRFAFLFPEGAPIPPMMNQSSPGESFATRAFSDGDEARKWLCGAE